MWLSAVRPKVRPVCFLDGRINKYVNTVAERVFTDLSLSLHYERHEFDEVEDMDTSEAQWCWFYLAECGVWHMFEINQSATCSVTSEQIEQNYSRNPLGIMEFSTAKYTYRLDFSVMKQTNMITGKQRPIKRSLLSEASFRFICDNLALPVPGHWERINTDEPYQSITLGGDTFEYKEVARLVERSYSDAPIQSIKRIQNLDLWEFFCRKKAQLKKIKQVVDIEEKMLFHGTDSNNVQAICTYNFDCRLAGMHASVYGKGTYFARDAKYAHKFCHTTVTLNTGLQNHGSTPPIVQSNRPYKSMFLARVLIGDYTLGDSKLCRPPPKDKNSMNFFDSCVDDISNPKIFVIFDCNQIYPEYLIEFYL